MLYVYLKDQESGLKLLFIAFLLSSVVHVSNISELTKLCPDIFSVHIWSKVAERFTQSCSKWLSFKVSWWKNSGCCSHVTSICRQGVNVPVHKSKRASLLPDKELFGARNDVPFIMKHEVICFPNGLKYCCVYLSEELVSHNCVVRSVHCLQ